MTQALAAEVVPALHAVAASNWIHIAHLHDLRRICLHIVDCWWMSLTVRPRMAAADASRALERMVALAWCLVVCPKILACRHT